MTAPVDFDKLQLLGEISELARDLEASQPAGLLDGTARPADRRLAEWEHQVVRDLIATGAVTFRDEVLDAVYQAFAEQDWPALRHALLLAAAQLVLWIQTGDRRGDLDIFGGSS